MFDRREPNKLASYSMPLTKVNRLRFAVNGSRAFGLNAIITGSRRVGRRGRSANDVLGSDAPSRGHATEAAVLPFGSIRGVGAELARNTPFTNAAPIPVVNPGRLVDEVSRTVGIVGDQLQAQIRTQIHFVRRSPPRHAFTEMDLTVGDGHDQVVLQLFVVAR